MGEKENTSHTSSNERLEYLAQEMMELKSELNELKYFMEKNQADVSADKGMVNASQTVVASLPIQPKAINAPGGMSTEQLQEFKKQTLQINGLQQKMKDLESKLTEATAAIKKSGERASETEEKGVESVKDLYATIDQINNSLSEKIAQQRVEMQKIAGDTPKAINYDPFNYGEAYNGDFVDFQARKRITEIKLLLHSLQAAMNTLRESVKVSPVVDLGYKVVRLDQLLASTKFNDSIVSGEATHEDAVLITQSAAREPGKLEMPRKEMFQTSDELESKWAITDSIMQTMYRLEMELGMLQKSVGLSDISSNTKILDELQTAIRQLKEKQIDTKAIKRIIDESMGISTPKIRQPSLAFAAYQQKENFGSRDEGAPRTNEESLRQIKNLSTAVDLLVQRFTTMETNFDTRPNAALRRVKQGEPKPKCMSCDRRVSQQIERNTTTCVPRGYLYDPTLHTNAQAVAKIPSRLKYTITRAYNIESSNGSVDVYSLPRPCGAGYTVYWPVVQELPGHKWTPPNVTGWGREHAEAGGQGDGKKGSAGQRASGKYGNPCGKWLSNPGDNIPKDTVCKKAQAKGKVDFGPQMKFRYIRGQDGRYYQGSDKPAVMSEYQKKVAALNAGMLNKNVISFTTNKGVNVTRETRYQGKQGVFTTSVSKSDGKKAVGQKMLNIEGKKEEKIQEGGGIQEEEEEKPNEGEEKTDEGNREEERETNQAEGNLDAEAIPEEPEPEPEEIAPEPAAPEEIDYLREEGNFEEEESSIFEEDVNDNAGFVVWHSTAKNKSNNSCDSQGQCRSQQQSSFKKIFDLIRATLFFLQEEQSS